MIHVHWLCILVDTITLSDLPQQAWREVGSVLSPTWPSRCYCRMGAVGLVPFPQCNLADAWGPSEVTAIL